MRFVFALIFTWFSFTNPVLAVCFHKESWVYNVEKNTCVRLWSSAGEFDTADECLASRAKKFKLIFGLTTSGSIVSFSHEKFDEWTRENAREGMEAQVSEQIFLNNFLMEESNTDFKGTQTRTSAGRGDCYRHITCRKRKIIEGDWIDGIKVSQLRKSRTIVSDRWFSTSHFSVNQALETFKFSKSSSTTFFYQESSGDWIIGGVETTKPSAVGSNSYLVEILWDCPGGVCPTIDKNLPKPPCDDGDDDDDDDDECPNLNIRIRGTLLPARRGTARVSGDGDWCK